MPENKVNIGLYIYVCIYIYIYIYPCTVYIAIGYAYPAGCIIILGQENIPISVQDSEFPRQSVDTKKRFPGL
jgi:hypothetical protein